MRNNYTNAWEQCKLGEVGNINGRIGFRGYTQKDIITKDRGGILTFSPTNIKDNQLVYNYKNTYITLSKYNESPEIQIHNGDILFVKTGSTLGKSALVSNLYENATLNPQVIVIRTKDVIQEFISVVLTTQNILNQVESCKIGGAVPTLTEEKIKKFTFYIPHKNQEIHAIGTFFKHLDHLLTLHQRK